jgi:metallophosphoesterase (TIGR03767 family)
VSADAGHSDPTHGATRPADPADTTRRTLRRTPAGPGGYRRLTDGPGEPHRHRADLLDGPDHPANTDRDQPDNSVRIAELLHLTDFQIADLASPSRVEYLQRLTGVGVWRRMLPAGRPQEFLLDQAVEQVVRTARRAVADGTAAPDLMITTGDNTDSAQLDELERYLALLDGGRIRPGAGNDDLAATPTRSGDPEYWNPEPESRDHWKTRHGFPDHPGALAAAVREFDAGGIGLPWLTCFGNHDCLVQGRAAARDDYDALLNGDRKPIALPDGPEPTDDALDRYVDDPYHWSTGPSIPIEPRPDRRLVTKQQWVQGHFGTGGVPQGHGFTTDNLADGTTWYVHDAIPGVRIIGLDTTNPAGHVDGCLDDRQFRWLERRLVEVHARYSDAAGRDVHTDADDRLVVLASHHGLSTLTNATGDGTWGGRLHLADEVQALLHRFPNVVLWLSGHTHVNRVTPRPGPNGGGFWEISTSSIAEWPVQLRSVELRLAPGAGVLMRSTMIDSDAPAAPGTGTSLADLAALHREVAANDAGSVGGLDAEGGPEDRNVDLPVPLPAATVDGLLRRQVARA